jgi:hypothetical protein
LAFNIKAVSFTLAQLNGQFGKLTDPTEGAPVPEPVEGALPKQYIYTVAHASGSESSVLFPWLILLLLISVKFRVNPWQCFCFTDSFATALGGSLTFYCPFCSTKFCNILDASFVSVH